jgi:hypothetical protein
MPFSEEELLIEFRAFDKLLGLPSFWSLSDDMHVKTLKSFVNCWMIAEIPEDKLLTHAETYTNLLLKYADIAKLPQLKGDIQ